MINISLEAMQAVIQSRLGKELDAIWDKVIEYRDTSLKDVSYINRLKALKQFFLKNCVDEIKECVWRNVGLHISEISVTSIEGESFCSLTYFDKTGSDNMSSTFHLENIINANYIMKALPEVRKYLNGSTPLTAEELVNIAKSFDKTTGGIKESVKLELRKLVYAVIGFDVETAFLMPDRLPVNAGVDYMTSREITAVMLHELGHTLSLIEHAGDCYARIATFDYLTDAFEKMNSSNIDESVKLAEYVANEINKEGDKTNADRLIKLSSKLKADYDKVEKSIEKNSTGRAVGGFIKSVMCFAKDLFVKNLQAKRFGGVEEKKRKFGDIPINGRLVTWEERKADEYALTHGYGADIASATSKLDKYLNRMGLSERQCEALNDAERLHQSMSFFAKAKLWIMIPSLASRYNYSLYPAGIKRFRELMNLTIQKLKANSSDPVYVTKYIQDIETILAICDNPNTREETIARMYKGYDIFIKYLSIPSFIDWLVHGRVNRELEDLIEDANAIGNNLLAYYGFKLQQLATK